MKNEFPNTQSMLLPDPLRVIGEALIFVLAAVFILVRLTGFAGLDKEPAFQSSLSALVVVSLFFITWSEEAEDDEQLRLYRLKATKATAFCCLLYFTLMSFLYTTGVYTAPQIQGMEQALGLILIYQLAYRLQLNVLK